MRISARADYAVRAAVALAHPRDGGVLSAEAIAEAEGIPASFLEGILSALRRGGIVESRRGAGGGYRLARDAADISVADVIRAVDGPLVYVRDVRPSEMDERDQAPPLVHLWVALRANVRRILEGTSLADVASGILPAHVRELAASDEAWANPS
ncbi:RrF2 family transcriptional regulator [Microbacterium thalassium]|uniref:Rrf2 family protein n=1 Tax=Microbacterium thalassium TaxID=362649 RepID=A0A7X0FPI3_9MICO|nr:Rrf2 family transcriptional regulator [Microbacterium thalassium]MBB6391314.1 Rrf2 family protein [Microbacterium thalassium]GLK23574.1 Rrf2 family transcriptional regulator [Microbacterium thalassium]